MALSASRMAQVDPFLGKSNDFCKALLRSVFPIFGAINVALSQIKSHFYLI